MINIIPFTFTLLQVGCFNFNNLSFNTLMHALYGIDELIYIYIYIYIKDVHNIFIINKYSMYIIVKQDNGDN